MNLLRSSGRSILNTALGNVLVRGMKECHTLYQTRHLINLQGLVIKCWEHPYCRISSCRQPRSLEGFGCPQLTTGTVTQLPFRFRLIEYPGLIIYSRLATSDCLACYGKNGTMLLPKQLSKKLAEPGTLMVLHAWLGACLVL